MIKGYNIILEYIEGDFFPPYWTASVSLYTGEKIPIGRVAGHNANGDSPQQALANLAVYWAMNHEKEKGPQEGPDSS